MKANGKMKRKMEKENSVMPMEMFMKVNFLKMKSMDLEFTNGLMVLIRRITAIRALNFYVQVLFLIL